MEEIVNLRMKNIGYRKLEKKISEENGDSGSHG
jgi:hypothetical protein